MECLPFTEYQMVTALSRLEVLLAQTYDEVECQQIINKMKWLGYELLKVQKQTEEAKKLGEISKQITTTLPQGEKQPATHFNYLTPLHPVHQNEVNLHKNQVFTAEQLSKYYNGKDGNPLYVCVEGLVFDVTELPNWTDETCEDENSTRGTLPNRIAKRQSDKVKQLIKQAKLVGVII